MKLPQQTDWTDDWSRAHRAIEEQMQTQEERNGAYMRRLIFLLSVCMDHMQIPIPNTYR